MKGDKGHRSLQRYLLYFILFNFVKSYPMGTRGSYHGGKVTRGVKLTAHLHLVPGLRMCGVIPPLPRYALMAFTLPYLYKFKTKACKKLTHLQVNRNLQNCKENNSHQ